jgi:hypothetical protein
MFNVVGAGLVPAHILYPPASSIALEAEINSATTLFELQIAKRERGLVAQPPFVFFRLSTTIALSNPESANQILSAVRNCGFAMLVNGAASFIVVGQQ